MGQEKELNLGLAKDLYVTIGQGQYDRLQAAINVEKVIKAPATKGTVLGTLAIQLDNKTIAVNHYPDKAQKLLQLQAYDVVCFGHDHSITDFLSPQ